MKGVFARGCASNRFGSDMTRQDIEWRWGIPHPMWMRCLMLFTLAWALSLAPTSAQSTDDFDEVLTSTFNHERLRTHLLIPTGDDHFQGFILLNRKLYRRMKSIGYTLTPKSHSDTLLLCQKDMTQIFIFQDLAEWTNKIDPYIIFESIRVKDDLIKFKFRKESLNFRRGRTPKPNLKASLTFRKGSGGWEVVKQSVVLTEPTSRFPY